MRCPTTLTLLLLFMLTAAQAMAVEDSDNLLCATNVTHDCGGTGACVQGTAQSIGVPVFFEVDFTDRQIIARHDNGREEKSRIDSLAVADDRVALQGVENGLAWSMLIMRDHGDMVVAGAGDGVGYVIHGSCIVP